MGNCKVREAAASSYQCTISVGVRKPHPIKEIDTPPDVVLHSGSLVAQEYAQNSSGKQFGMPHSPRPQTAKCCCCIISWVCMMLQAMFPVNLRVPPILEFYSSYIDHGPAISSHSSLDSKVGVHSYVYFITDDGWSYRGRIVPIFQ